MKIQKNQVTVQNLFKFTSIKGRLPLTYFKIWYLTILQQRLAYDSAI